MLPLRAVRVARQAPWAGSGATRPPGTPAQRREHHEGQPAEHAQHPGPDAERERVAGLDPLVPQQAHTRPAGPETPARATCATPSPGSPPASIAPGAPVTPAERRSGDSVKSACFGCPSHGNAGGRRIGDHDPEGLRQAVEADRGGDPAPPHSENPRGAGTSPHRPCAPRIEPDSTRPPGRRHCGGDRVPVHRATCSAGSSAPPRSPWPSPQAPPPWSRIGVPSPARHHLALAGRPAATSPAARPPAARPRHPTGSITAASAAIVGLR